MTMPAHAEGLGPRLPSAEEKAAAHALRRALAARMSDGARLRLGREGDTSSEIVLTPGLSKLLVELLRYVERGDAVTLVPVSQTLTTQQAASILNVSRPHLISLLDKNAIKYSFVGRHRRIKAADLLAFKANRDRARSDALSELAQLDGEHL